MSEEITSVEGDTVERICSKKYGYTANVTKQVYGNNPGLAALGTVLPIGTKVLLPEAPKKNEIQTDNLWD